MEFMGQKVRVESAETMRERVADALGWDTSSALDLVRREDYDSEDAYLDAATQAELKRQVPEYSRVRRQLKAQLRERKEQETRSRQNEEFNSLLAKVTVGDVDNKAINAEAQRLARNDLAAGKIRADQLGEQIEKHWRTLTAAKKKELASSELMNAELRRLARGL